MSIYQLAFTLFTAALWSVNGYLGNLSTEKAEVSVREPLIQLQIVWAVIIGVIVFHDTLSPQQMLGICFVILASLVLVFNKKILHAKIDKNTLLLLVSYTFVTAVVAAMDKQVVSFLAPQAYLIFSFIVPIPFLIPFIKLHKQELKNARNHIGEMFAISVIFFDNLSKYTICLQKF